MAFDPRTLIPLAGLALNRNTGSGGAFMRGWMRAQQELEERRRQSALDQRQTRMDDVALGREQRIEDYQQQQLMLQADAAERARAAAEEQANRNFLTSIGALVNDESLTDPAEYERRKALIYNTAPKSIERGFLDQTLRIEPSVFQQRAAKRKLAEIARAYSPQQLAMLETDDSTGSAPVFEVGGEQLTIGQLRERAGVGALVGGRSMSLRPPEKPDTPNTPEEQFYQRYAKEKGYASWADVPTTEQATARKTWMQADDRPPDPVIAELRELRLEQQRRAAQASAALPPTVQRRVDMKTRAFDSQPVVKKIQTMAEAVAFAENLNVNTANPADDQALIYAYAKAMDPDSVVREGEYATVQKYAQSWAERFGFDVARMFSNTTFLTPQARANMKATIRTKFASAKPQYENIRRQYVKQINQIT
ncbi:MAG TPA: hypothetical protein VEA16_02450, partial [Vicinamibacterales bacterium]|nr:hypothetical protein [Vicinamibacterales bacterium]